MVRIPESHDWVIFIILGCIVVLTVMLQQLQREATLRDFIVQGMADRSNILPSWLLISLVTVLLLTTLISQYVPIVPRSVNNFSIFGLSLNKFGYTFWCLILFYVVRTVLSYLFFAFIGQLKRFSKLYFIASKFYLVLSVILLAAVFALYYLPVDRDIFLSIILFAGLVVVTGKNIFYLLHRGSLLPEEWYYKILYICTLQFAPLLALWQLLFY